MYILSHAKDQNVFYPSVESIIEYAQEEAKEEKTNQEDKPNVEVCEKLLAEVDNLYEAHEQVSKYLKFISFHCCLSLQTLFFYTLLFRCSTVKLGLTNTSKFNPAENFELPPFID